MLAILQSPFRASVLPRKTEPPSFKVLVPSKHLAAYPSFPLGQLLLGMGLNQVRPFLLNEKQSASLFRGHTVWSTEVTEVLVWLKH